jgi:hypothetical protein
MNSCNWETLIREDIENESNVNILEWLADAKKYIWFQNILRNIFCDWATKDKLIFFNKINQIRLNEKNKSKKEVIDYLNEKFEKEQF